MNLDTLTLSIDLTPFNWDIETRSERWIGGRTAWVQIGPFWFSFTWENC